MINSACSRQRLGKSRRVVLTARLFWLDRTRTHTVALIDFFSLILETFLIILVSVSTLTHTEKISEKVKNKFTFKFCLLSRAAKLAG